MIKVHTNHTIIMEHGICTIFKRNIAKATILSAPDTKIASEIGSEFVPENLYPNMLDIAQKIIDEAKAK